MNIALVINSLSRGGAEKNLALLANHWAADNHQVTIFTFQPQRTLPAFTLEPSISYQGLDLTTRGYTGFRKLMRLIQLPLKLRKALLAARPAVVVSFMDQTNILCLMALLGTRIPVIVAERVNPAYSSLCEPEKPFWLRQPATRLRNIIYRLAAKIVVLTGDTINYFPAAIQGKCCVIPNPILAPEKQTADLTLPKPCVMAMGRLVPQKRFDLLLRAFAKTAQKQPTWSLVIVGQGPKHAALEEEIARLNLRGRAFLPGATKTPYGVLRQADLFVLCSDYEGFPGALGEAMACGLPVIATDCDYGPREMIKSGWNGMLIKTGDADALAAALEELMLNSSKRRELGANAAAVINRFSLKEFIKRWNQILDEIHQCQESSSLKPLLRRQLPQSPK